MVYCAAFDRNANSSKNNVTCSWFKFPMEPIKKKKVNFKPTKHRPLCSLQENLFQLRYRPEKMAALGYPDAKISLKEDVVPTLFPVVEAILMPSIHRTPATIWASTMVHLGSKQVPSEFGQHSLVTLARNSGAFGLRAQQA